MSIINQMLKDLDRRKADQNALPAMPENVRAVESAEAAIGWKLLLSVGVFLLAAILGYFAWSRWSAQPQVAQLLAQKPRPSAAKAASAAPSTPAPQSAPPAAMPATTAVAPAEAAAPPVAEAMTSRLPGLERELHSSPASPLPKAEQHKPSPASAPPATAPLQAVENTRGAADEKPKDAKPSKMAKAPRDGLLKSVTPQQKSDNLYKQAVALLQQGRVAEARSTLWQALDENAANHNARQLLVGLLVESKRSNDALALLQEGVKIAPEQTGFVMALARLQVEAGNRQLGMQTLEQGLKYAADDAEYHAFYAALLQREERHADAVDHYLIALRQDPANVSWLIGVGISLQAQGKYADAREAFGRARQIDTLTPDLQGFVDQRLAQLKGK